MDNHKRTKNQEQLEAHSLPGINMAGKGPGDRDDEERAVGAPAQSFPKRVVKALKKKLTK